MFSKSTRVFALILFIGGSKAIAADAGVFKMNGEIKSATCTFKNDAIRFDFGRIDASVFTGIGSTSGWVEEHFESAGCDAGISTVLMTFSGSADDDNPSLIKVTGGASGVGIELQSWDDVVAIPDNTTKMRWAPRNVDEIYEFKARYVQTKDRITGGMANATLTVNLSYL